MPTRSRAPRGGFGGSVAGVAIGVATVGVVTLACRAVFDHALQDVVMVYLLAVVVLAVRFGYAASLPATALSVLSFDFFFTEPYFSFLVDDRRFLLTFVLMAFVALVISHQTEGIRRREARSAALYAMSRELTSARSDDEMATIAYRHVRDVGAGAAWIVVPAIAGGARVAGAPDSPPDDAIVAAASAIFDPVDGVPVPVSSSVPASVPARDPRTFLLALRASSGVVGVLAVRAPHARAAAVRRDRLDAFVSPIALALERARLAGETERAQIEIQNERLRSALLSSVSHDLRTPLAVIKGAATSLLDGGARRETDPDRRDHLVTISAEATRLNRIVSNVLRMTSIEAGAMRLHAEWLPVEEVVGVALQHLDEALEGRAVDVRIDADASLACFDATLIEQVLTNLIENAIKYTPASSPIGVRARRAGDDVAIEVVDAGPGVPEGRREAIFDKFCRVAVGPPGMGLGLTICRAIVAAHGGSIACTNRPEGGASFRFTLPRKDGPPAPGALPEIAEDA